MTDLWSSAVVFVILLGSAIIGMLVQRFLSDSHRSRETRELSQAVTGMLVTLAALVLGLLTSSVKQSFDRTESDLRAYAVDLIELGQSLRDFGPPAQAARGLLRTYVIGAIVSTWPGEPKPPGATGNEDFPASAAPHPTIESEALGTMLDRVGHQVRGLPQTDQVHNLIAARALERFGRVIDGRWKLLEDAHSSIPMPFYRVLVFWLLIVFATLGLIAPRNLLALAMIVLAAIAIASVMFAIMEMDTPFGGLIYVPSEPMRDALAHLSE
jgi:hypothetical protein